MTPNGSPISIAHRDPLWATMDASAARSNRPDFVSVLRGPAKYQPGREYEQATRAEIAEKLTSIADGKALKTPVRPSGAIYPDDKLDFENATGMIAGLNEKAKTLPTKEAFLPIVNGFGTIDRAAIDAWRIFVTASAPSTQLNQAFGLGRGISR